MNKTIYTAVALLLLGIASIVPWADAQQKPNPVIIWCQDTSGNYAPCLAGNSIDYDSGAGTVNQGTVGIVLPASGGPVAGGTSTNPIRTDPTGTTPQPVTQSGTWTVQPGNTANTTAWAFKLDQTSTNNDVDIASALPAGTNTIGNVGVLPTTSGGTTPCYITSAATTNATNCKASAGQLYGYDLVNTTTTIYYLRIYNLSSAPTCSSATGFVRTIPVPPAGAAGQAGGIARSLPVGEAYGTGLGFCLTGGGSSTDNTNAATGVYVSLNYK